MFGLFKRTSLEVGDKIRIAGGYQIPPMWMNGKEYYLGTVEAFIKSPYPGQIDAVVKLEWPIKFEQVGGELLSGDILVLTLRFTGARWKKGEYVHVHLFDHIPQESEWALPSRENWEETHIESHAHYRIIEKQNKKLGN